MKVLSLLFGLMCFSTAYSEDIKVDGTYRYIGFTCKNPSDLTIIGRSHNDDYKFLEKQNIIQITPTNLISKNKTYKFNGYREDSCEVLTTRALSQTGQLIKGQFVSQKAVVTGDQSQVVCEKFRNTDAPWERQVLVQGNYLYFVSSDLKPSPTICKNGPAYELYQKTSSFEFLPSNRPTKSKDDLKHEAAIKVNPKSVKDLEGYSHYLFSEERVSETKSVLAQLIAVDPKNQKAQIISEQIKKYETESDPFKRTQLVSAFSIQSQTADLSESLKDLQSATKSLEQLTATFDTPEMRNFQEQAAEEKKQKTAQFLKDYPFEQLKDKQYEASIKEHSAYYACVKAKGANYEQAKGLMEKAVSDYPNSPFILGQYLRFLIDSGDYDRAISKFEAEKSRYPDQLNMLVFRRHFDLMKQSKEPGKRKEISQGLESDLSLLEDQMRSLSKVTLKR